MTDPYAWTHYVCGFMVNEDEHGDIKNVVMIQKTHPAWQKDLWNGIGGKVEMTDRSSADAMVREFKEETGIDTRLTDWSLRVRVNDPPRGYTVDYFRAVVPVFPDVQSMTDEKVAILPIIDVYHGVYRSIDNMQWILPLCLDFMTSVAPGEYVTVEYR